MDFETRAIHDGQEPDPATGAIITPIYQTSTYVQEAVGVHKGYDYARVANPTRTALQVALASLENAEHGIAFSSGLGATTTLMHLVNPGERVVLIADVYGGVYRMTSQVYEPKGYVFDYVPATEFANLAAHLDENTRMVWVESPSNPMLNVVDIRAAADAAQRSARSSSSTTPSRRRTSRSRSTSAPTSSSTRRRSTSAATRTSSAASSPRTTRRSPSASASCRSRSAPCPARSTPGSCCAGSRRSRSACASTARTRARSPAASRGSRRRARALPGPARASRPRDRQRQMRDFGGMISFLAETRGEAVELVARTKLFELAESLGGVESLIEHPARMTHASTADAPFAPPWNLVRLSVGIESADDLIADLDAALVPAAAHAK